MNYRIWKLWSFSCYSISPKYEIATCTEHSQQKTVCPAEASFHRITQAYETCPHYSLVLVLPQCRSLLAVLQIALKIQAHMLVYLFSEIPTFW